MIDSKTVFVLLAIVAVEYAGVLLAIVADLWSGWHKAAKRGERRTSRALRRTVDKIARYFNALMALTVIDVMVIAGVCYVRSALSWKIPIIPVFTLIGSISLALIEVKSICEKSNQKGDIANAAKLMKDMMNDPSFVKILDWIKENISQKPLS